MSVEVVVSANFRRKAKKYIKKFHSLKEVLLRISFLIEKMKME